MDAHEDDSDIKLQKISTDLIADFSRSLPLFLRKPDGKTLRNRVRTSETQRLTSSLLDPFQELPQLLDPHLPTWLPLLANTYLEHLNARSRGNRIRQQLSTRSQLLEPLNLAIAKLLYTFTKIRGEKVVVRFLNVETRHIEPLLSALESAERSSSPSTTRPSLNPLSPQTDSTRAAQSQPWSWEERYLVLLWLSHLLLAPFDLSTISSAAADEQQLALPSIPDFEWPSASLPGITVRILPLAIKYLASPGKERDGARALLVRIAMRRDMQALGVLSALVRWALASLNPSSPESTSQPPYFYIGVLSFLAGVLRSSINTSDMDAYLSPIFRAAYAVASSDVEDTPVSAAIRSVAVARKMLIKVIRSVAVLLLRKSPPDPNSTELIETSIGYFLECLADNDTPVRLVASKALSIVTLKLDPDMASQVVDAVLDSLNRNVLWVREPGSGDSSSSSSSSSRTTRDLAAVDPLEWHGLMLTLSHLLYRRSPPASQLPDIVHGLLLGLSFEKRSTSGGSVGTNVRDAACFGIWALARRYTTAELLEVPTAAVAAARSHHRPDASILQVLATELVVTASLDSAGNIRRGASAALQELIGRHPDTVDKGIWVVQTVDYHAVALRSRAVHDVALRATKLSPQYGAALLDGLLGWRGIGDADAASRRVAGASFGTLTLELSRLNATSSGAGGGAHGQFAASIDKILARLRALQARQVDERHGLLLCLAAVLDQVPELLLLADDVATKEITRRIIRELQPIFRDLQTTAYRRPELVVEASSRLITSSLPILQAATLQNSEAPRLALRPGHRVVSTENTTDLLKLMRTVDALDNDIPDDVAKLVDSYGAVVSAGLARPEKEAIAASSEAALTLLVFSQDAKRKRIIEEWANAVRHRPTSRAANDTGVLFALTMAYPLTAMPDGSAAEAEVEGKKKKSSVICDTILARWAGDNDIDARVAILQSLSQSVVLRNRAPVFLDLLSEGLNDYTTNARGDVGSHVRLEALRASKLLWKASLTSADDSASSDPRNATKDRVEWLPAAVSKLFLRILRLSAEKLDRVRTEAHAVVALMLDPSFASSFTKLTFSSKEYFYTLLNLYNAKERHLHQLVSQSVRVDDMDAEGGWAAAWMAELLAGYVTSADTGNEDLVIASRAALADFCAENPRNLTAVCAALVANLGGTRHGQAQGQQDRVVVPTLEIVAFLCHAGLFQRCRRAVDLRRLCLLVQKAGYKTGNVRKLEACIKVYGCVAGFPLDEDEDEDVVAKGEGESVGGNRRRDGVLEARKRLGALMLHPWPRVRSQVVDELWKLFGEAGASAAPAPNPAAESLKGVDWSKADKSSIKSVIERLGLNPQTA